MSVTGLDTLVDMFGMEAFSGRAKIEDLFGRGENFLADIRGGHGTHGLIASQVSSFDRLK